MTPMPTPNLNRRSQHYKIVNKWLEFFTIRCRKVSSIFW